MDLATDSPSEDVTIKLEEAVSGKQHDYKTRIKHQVYPTHEVALEMFRRLEEAQDPDDPDSKMRTIYTDKFSVGKLEEIVKESLKRIGTKKATESMKQKFLQSLGTLRRKDSQNVRYRLIVDEHQTVPTQVRPADSASAPELRYSKTFFFTDQTRATLAEEQMEFFDEVTESSSGFKVINVHNHHDFKTPLNAVIADSENERRFINRLIDPANVQFYDAWIKSTAVRFYEIDYAWKKGEHPKRGKFNPDFFIKVGNLILVIEVKDEEQLREPSPENKKKNEYAIAHFDLVNSYLMKAGSPIRYKFNFLTEGKFNTFFQSLREGQIEGFRSELDVKLAE